MPVSATAAGSASWLATRRGMWTAAAVVLALAVAGALSISSFWRPGGGAGAGAGGGVQSALNAGANSVGNAVNALKSVADMFADRSPGARTEGALASLKHKRLAAIHERALPKVRRPAATTPLAGIVGAAPAPPAAAAIPPAAPVYDVVSGVPGTPVGQTPVPGSPPGGFPAIPPLPGGGGGGIITPPIVTITPPPPVIPVTPSVPEPATWAMMLVGFAMIGSRVRRCARIASTDCIA